MEHRPHALGRLGIDGVSRAASTALGWHFLEQTGIDVGLDGYFEVVSDGIPTGRMLGVQLKVGSAYFNEPMEQGYGWVYRGRSRKLLDYWLTCQLPILLVLYDPDTNTAYWQHITPETVQITPTSFKIIIPSSQRLDESSKSALKAIAGLPTKSTAANSISPQEGPGGATVVNEAVATAVHNLIQAGTIQGGVHIHGVGVRPGQPGQEARFQAAFDLAGGAVSLGSPMGQVQLDGPGWVQPFDGGPTGRPAVICALPRKTAVAVATHVWDEICAVGEGTVLGGTSGVGYPSAEQGPYIDADRELIVLEGGRWGRSGQGNLIRRRSGRPLWRPKIVLDGEATQERDRWTGTASTADLRIRLASRIPLVANELRVTGSGRSRMTTALSSAGLTRFINSLAQRHGLGAPDASWQEVDEIEGPNDSRFATYKLVIESAGAPTATAFLWFTLPSGSGVEVFSGVDLRINVESRPSRSDAENPVPVEFRLSHRDLIDFYSQAWHVATMVSPLVACEALVELSPAGAPRLELHVTNEMPHMAGDTRTFSTTELIDLSVFGTSRRLQVRDLSAAVTAPLGLDVDEIGHVVRRALVWMTEDAGFTAADTAVL
jgi:hypothetical protein